METKRLTAEELGDYLRKSPGTLKNWRVAKKGPPYTIIGGTVLYPVDQLEAWLAANTVYPEGQRQKAATA